jgi:hypothetical protein
MRLFDRKIYISLEKGGCVQFFLGGYLHIT